jgi:hypothetical protein
LTHKRLSATALGATTVATATTWTVDPSGPGDFADLATAMASVGVRDTLMLADGVRDLGVDGYVHDGLIDATSRSELGETVITGGRGGTPALRFRWTTAEMRFPPSLTWNGTGGMDTGLPSSGPAPRHHARGGSLPHPGGEPIVDTSASSTRAPRVHGDPGILDQAIA